MSRIAGIFQRKQQPADRESFANALRRMLRHPQLEKLQTAFHEADRLLLGRIELIERKFELDSNDAQPDKIRADSQQPSTIHYPLSTLVCDARLDQRDALLQQLEIPRAEYAAANDSALILAAYRKWGADCAQHLCGDFAFAIWDAPHRRLFCARDHLGLRPFYYHLSGGVFCFASEIKFLLQLPEISHELNRGRIADYLLRFFEKNDETFYRSIQRLPPGHRLIVDADNSRLERWFAFDPERRSSDSDMYSAMQRFEELLKAAIITRAQDSAAPGYLLSGGLDSSSIVALARHVSGNPLQTFSATFPTFPNIDETRYIELLKEKFGLRNVATPVDRLHPLGAIDEMYRVFDEPFYTPNLYVYWELCKQAQAAGVRVLIDGVDGDTTVSHGVRLLTDYFQQGRMIQFARESRRAARRFQTGWPQFFWHYGPAQGWLEPLRCRVHGWFGPPPPIPEFFRPALKDYIERTQRYLPLRAHFVPPANHRDEHLRSLQSGMLGMYLEMNDQTAAAFGLAHSHPYYSRPLMEYCLSLPSELRFQGGWDRLVQRNALRPHLPGEIVNRIHKSVWTECFLRAFTTLSRNRVQELLEQKQHPLDEFADRRMLLALYQKNFSGAPRETELIHVWTGVTLGLWLEKIAG